MAVLKAILLSSALLACAYAQGEPVHVELPIAVSVGGRTGPEYTAWEGRCGQDAFAVQPLHLLLKDRVVYSSYRLASLPRSMHWLSFMPRLTLYIHVKIIAFLGFLSVCVGLI